MAAESSFLPPGDPDLLILFHALSDDEKEAWSERAGILEFDAGYPRSVAERRAMDEVLRWRNLRPLQ
jgi:hypothetical protein